MPPKLSVSNVNSLQEDEFEEAFCNVIELCPDAAKRVKRLRPFKGTSEISAAFCQYLEGINAEDLAGRLAARGQLTKESTDEQRSAGLHELTAADNKLMDESNQRYKEKFGFPFIICARENKVESIIAGLQARYHNTYEQEIKTGIEEVKKICTLRINDIMSD
ncbi:Uncharacterized protein OBRU01_22748 [Operophtera brumata]|uniref:2-oxo-4-hydroxy-4-carboxy-5-ureidoimidazoline decarboxylase n=1 Tax=Operophtera brumata TaxID=104452 RepID=A0A0L7KQ70_OPEBR|nr:Uncharacterized protein OBRU01_22748 [Operophtera brumata]